MEPSNCQHTLIIDRKTHDKFIKYVPRSLFSLSLSLFLSPLPHLSAPLPLSLYLSVSRERGRGGTLLLASLQKVGMHVPFYH